MAKNTSTTNTATNGANYQHDGTEPLRCNPQTFRAPIISDPTDGTHLTPGTVKQLSGTEETRGNVTHLHAAIIADPTGGSVRNTPAAVDHFKDACV